MVLHQFINKAEAAQRQNCGRRNNEGTVFMLQQVWIDAQI